ncbi:transmembrane proteins 14C-domain-containing protein [Apiospora arundinis]
MAEHPSFTLAGLLAVGGTMGYVRTQSKPSLIAGVGLGISYAYAGYLIKENRDYGTELALGNSALLTASAIPRIIKTGGRAPCAPNAGRCRPSRQLLLCPQGSRVQVRGLV